MKLFLVFGPCASLGCATSCEMRGRGRRSVESTEASRTVFAIFVGEMLACATSDSPQQDTDWSCKFLLMCSSKMLRCVQTIFESPRWK